MNGGFVRVIACWDIHSGQFEMEDETKVTFYPVKDIVKIVKVHDPIHFDMMEAEVITYLSNSQPPFYQIETKRKSHCILDPNCKDQITRILAGKNTAMDDLVNELRYNPSIGLEVRSAQRSFESNIK